MSRQRLAPPSPLRRSLFTAAALVFSLAVLVSCTLGSHVTSVPEGMVLIPAGDAIVGSDDLDTEGRAAGVGSRKPWYLDEHPRHLEFLPAYFFDRYEATNKEYRRFHPSHVFPQGAENDPVVNVTWFEADAYCRRAGKRLPSEIEWEKAARGPAGFMYPWGDQYDDKKGNVGGAGLGGPRPVGSFPEDRSPHGVYDMAGNVMEWTASWYLPYQGSDYHSPDFGEKFRVVRGDSWGDQGHYYLSVFTRSSYRLNVLPGERYPFIGFRCARSQEAR